MCTQIMKPHALVLAVVALVSFTQPAHAYNAGTFVCPARSVTTPPIM